LAELAAPLILASASPRRREILETLGLVFEVVPSDVPEVHREGEAPRAYVERLSADKALHVARAGAGRRPAPFVLGADTTVVLGEEVLEKPEDDADATRIIARLSGQTHRVITAVSIARAGEGLLRTIASETEVTFRSLSDDEVAAYVASGEGRDKAGAYGIQGLGSGLVTALVGDYFNVVGLPASAVIQLLFEVGALARWP
jgi:septum formation protein